MAMFAGAMAALAIGRFSGDAESFSCCFDRTPAGGDGGFAGCGCVEMGGGEWARRDLGGRELGGREGRPYDANEW